MRKYLTMVVLLFISVATYAQQHSVKGTVVDQNGYPVIGMTVLEQGTQNGTTTDIDGNYQLSVSSGTAYQEAVHQANQIICNIDRIKETDPSMTDKEYREWKSEAILLKAYALFLMSQIWGDIPVENALPPAITEDNVEEVFLFIILSVPSVRKYMPSLSRILHLPARMHLM